ncbi:MAG: DUF4923 family protein [Prevotella sp.]|jgi:hypothetical protein|nr:DUF4923 family protein [Prevotella sp.]
MKKSYLIISSVCLLGLMVATISSCGAGTFLQTMGSGGTVGNIFTSVIGLDKVSEKGLIGTWKYNGPGVAFTSENLLAKAGGEVAATKIEQELTPYFQQAGISAQNTSVVFNEDKTFRATIAGKSFSGTWSFDEAQAKVTLQGLLLSVNCYAKREYGGIALLFESKRLLQVLQVLATLSGNQTAQKVGDLSKNYDGIRLGFDMKK